jgi:hypothetical protein
MKRLAFAAAFMSGLMPSILAAALPPTAYQNARVSAPHHVQIAVTRVTPPANGARDCVVTGRIVTVFKGPLRVGDSVSLRKSCTGRAIGQIAQPDLLPPGPQIYVETANLQRARYLEAFLNNDPIELAADQAVIITSPSRTPRCSPASPGPICVPTR